MTLKISKWLFLLLIVSLPLVRPFYVTISGLRVPFSDFIFVAVFALWVVALIRQETRVRFDVFYYFLAVYGFALTISTIFSAQPEKSYTKLIGVFYLLGLAVITFNLARERGFYKQIVLAWLTGSLLTVLASAAGLTLFYVGFKTQAENYFLSHFGSLPAGNYPRIHALFANANMMCNFLNVSFMLAILAESTRWLSKKIARTLQFGILAAAFLTFSAGLGGLALSFGVWLSSIYAARQKRVHSRFILGSAVLFAVLVFCSTLISPDSPNDAFETSLPFSDTKIEASVRVLVWENALDNFLKNPWIGQGTGTNAALLKYQTLSGSSQILLDAHNSWLNIAVQCGLAGFAAFLSLTIFLTARCRFRLNDFNEKNLLRLALSCAFLGAFLYQGLSGSFEDARHLWILFGLLVGTRYISEDTGVSGASHPNPKL